MRRYTSLLALAFVLVLGTVFGAFLLSGHADRTPGRHGRTVTVCTTMPPEQASLLAAEYEKTAKVDVRFIPMTPEELTSSLSGKSKQPDADLVLADSRVMRTGALKGAFVPYISEGTDSVPDVFKDDEGAWTGVWYDPVVFCMNSDPPHRTRTPTSSSARIFFMKRHAFIVRPPKFIEQLLVYHRPPDFARQTIRNAPGAAGGLFSGRRLTAEKLSAILSLLCCGLCYIKKFGRIGAV